MTALERLGMKGHKRYELVSTAVLIIRSDNRYLTESVPLYQRLAVQYHTTSQAVAAQIHTLSKCAWNTNRPLLEEIAGYRLPKPPSSSEFLAMLYVDSQLHPEYDMIIL